MEMETHGGRSRITDTLDIPDLRRSLRLVLSKSSASSNYSHSTQRRVRILCDDRRADGPFRLYTPKGWQSSDAMFPGSGNGFGLARFIGNAY